MPRLSKRLVIDASIARSSGGAEATFPTSKHCRDLLQAVLRICHRIVMTPKIKTEWDEHQSNFARRWRVSMESRKKVCHLESVPESGLGDKIRGSAQIHGQQEAMLNDLHLILAALETDRVVISLDEQARAYFGQSAVRIGELRAIAWVNPDSVDDQAIGWLEAGASPEKKRQLGSRSI